MAETVATWTARVGELRELIAGLSDQLERVQVQQVKKEYPVKT